MTPDNGTAIEASSTPGDHDGLMGEMVRPSQQENQGKKAGG